MLFSSKGTSLSKTVDSTVKWLYGIFGTIIIVLGIFYLIHSNKTATSGFELLVLEQERKNLLVELEQWNTKLSTMLSVSNLESVDIIMEKPSRVTFVNKDSNVAQKIDMSHLLN